MEAYAHDAETRQRGDAGRILEDAVNEPVTAGSKLLGTSAIVYSSLAKLPIPSVQEPGFTRDCSIRRHRPLRFGVGCRFRSQHNLFAAPVLGGAAPGLVVLALLVELDAGANTNVVGNVGRADCID